jgi:hypothetical protein
MHGSFLSNEHSLQVFIKILKVIKQTWLLIYKISLL